jgi:hypothetical protein
LSNDTTLALLSTVQSLWPAATVRLATGRRPRPDAVAEFAMVPHGRAPRLLVPVVPRAAAARSLRRFSAAASARDTIGRLVTSGFVDATGLAAFPDRIVVTGSAPESLASYLSGVLDSEVTFSIGIGTARVNRKPVLQVFDLRGRPLAFVKLGDTPLSRSDVSAEGIAIGQLAGHPWRELAVPTLLHQGTWNEMVVLVLSALPTSPRQLPRDQWVVPTTAMRELTTAFGEPPRALDGLPWLDRQRAIAAALGNTVAGARLDQCIDAIVSASAGRTWPIGAWHGDWTPWNMARGNGHLQVWDWERFETGVPQGLDPFHYTVNAVTRRSGTTPDTIREGLAMAGAEPGDLLGALYLLAIAGRYLPLAEGDRGGDIEPRAQVTLDTLVNWLDPPR